MRYIYMHTSASGVPYRSGDADRTDEKECELGTVPVGWHRSDFVCETWSLVVDVGEIVVDDSRRWITRLASR